jgi:hypothetical protein
MTNYLHSQDGTLWPAADSTCTTDASDFLPTAAQSNTSSFLPDLIQKAITLVTEATEEDCKGKYAEAAALYALSIEYFTAALTRTFCCVLPSLTHQR